MSQSSSYYDSDSNDQYGSRTIIVKTQNPQRVAVAADGMLAIPESTTRIYRSASTGACSRRGDVKVIYRSKTGGSRSPSPERGRTLHHDEKIYARSYTSRSRSRSRNPQAEIHVTHLDVKRPTYIKVCRKYLSPDTLDAYNLPWEWDSDINYIIIKQWISYDYQQVLFAHTRRIRESKVVVSRPTAETETTTKITMVKTTSNDQDRNNLYVVRKKDRSPSRSPSRTTVVYKKQVRSPSRSPNRTTVVYKKKVRSPSRSPNRTTVVYT